jgi:hypothetical protein
MAQRKNGAGNAPTTKKQPTAAEMRDWFAKNKGNLERYEETKNALINLRDVSKSTKLKSIQVITKEELRTYLENPSNYESQLRNISWYLLTR